MQDSTPNSRTLTTDQGPVTVRIIPEPEPEMSIQVTYLAAAADRTPQRSEVFTPQEMALIFQQPPRAPEQYWRTIARTSAIAASLIIALALWTTNHTPDSANAAPATQPLSVTKSPSLPNPPTPEIEED